jgi:hypothetical protein
MGILKQSRLASTRFHDQCLESTDQQFALVDHFGRKVVMHFNEEPLMANDFLSPGGTVNFH